MEHKDGQAEIMKWETAFAVSKDAQTRHALFSAYYEGGLQAQAKGALDQALSLWEKAYMLTEEQTACSDRILVCHALAAALLAQGHSGNAQTMLLEATELAQAWVADEECLASLEALCINYDNRGMVALRTGYANDAIRFFQKAQQTAFRALSFSNDGERLHTYSVMLSHLSEAYTAKREPHAAMEAALDALSALSGISEAEQKPQYGIAAVNLHRKVGTLMQAIGNQGEAKRHYRDAAQQADTLLTQEDSVEVTRQAAQSHFSLGKLQQAMGEGLLATGSLLRALELATRNVDRCRTPMLLDDWAVALCTFGDHVLDRGKVEQAIAVWQELCERYPQNQTYAQKKQYAQGVLARFPKL